MFQTVYEQPLNGGYQTEKRHENLNTFDIKQSIGYWIIPIDAILG